LNNFINIFCADHPDVALAVLTLWCTIADAEFSPEEVCDPLVFTTAPHLAPAIVATLVAASDVDGGEWDLGAAAHSCLFRLPCLSFGLVSDVCLSIGTCPAAALTLSDILWRAGAPDFRAAVVLSSIASVLDGLHSKDSVACCASLVFLNSLLKEDQRSPILRQRPLDGPDRRLTGVAIARQLRRMQSVDHCAATLALFASVESLTPSAAAEAFEAVGLKTLRPARDDHVLSTATARAGRHP
jgi:hypothetical protein